MSAVSGGEPRAVAPSARPPLPVPRRLLRMGSDATLAERVAAGDESAFDVLYERHRPVVLAVCMGILGTAHDAEDATQETFTALSIALRDNIPAELRPWLIRVARNASIDTTRRRKHRLLTLDGELPDLPARPAAGSAELAVVMDGIRELPEQQRTALLMRELGGHSYAEIGDFMEIDEAAVRGLIARARVGLRSHREAAELPCATARACIETEPDGRRYDRTIRRHLRTCAACRSYRTALRGDARALRAALPFQTGAFSTSGGGLASGALSAGKAALVGAGMSQLAAACAASVCAVGTVGGMVLIAPVHRTLDGRLTRPASAAVGRPHRHHPTPGAMTSLEAAGVRTSSSLAARGRVSTSASRAATKAVSHRRNHGYPGASLALGVHKAGSGVAHDLPEAAPVHRGAGPTAPAVSPPASGGTATRPPSNDPSVTAGSSAGGGTTATAGSSGAGGVNATTTGGIAGGGGSTVTSGGVSGIVTGGTASSGVSGGTGGTTSGGIGGGGTATTTLTVQSPPTPVTNTVNNVLGTVGSAVSGEPSSTTSTMPTTTTPSPPLGLVEH